MKKAFFTIASMLIAVLAVSAAEPGTIKQVPKHDNTQNIIDAIVAQNKDKVVFIDFWATWCGPCVKAMETIKPLKPWMHDNDIVSIYITNHTSDEEKWNGMVAEIGSVHYKFTEEEWKEIKGKYTFNSIPTYFIFNKKGEMVFQKSGFPGNEKMQEEFEKALK